MKNYVSGIWSLASNQASVSEQTAHHRLREKWEC